MRARARPARGLRADGRASPSRCPARSRAALAPAAAATWSGSCSAGRTTPFGFYLTTCRPRSASLVLGRGRRRSVSLTAEPRSGARRCCCAGSSCPRLLHALAGEGLPVPAARRARRSPSSPRGRCVLRPVAPAVRRVRGRLGAARSGRRAGRGGPSLLRARPGAACSPPTAGEFLAGSGGVPGGREAGAWVGGERPGGRGCSTIGPSMANVLAVLRAPQRLRPVGQPEPAHRNPSYHRRQPRPADPQRRASSTSSGTPSPRHGHRRSPGSCWRTSTSTTAVVVHTETVTVTAPDGRPTRSRSSRVYEVRP